MLYRPDGFEIIQQPARLEFRAWSRTLPSLFEQSALALASILVDVQSVLPEDVTAVEISADDPQALLFNWLTEILYLRTAEGKVFSKFEVISHKRSEAADYLQADLYGQKFDPGKHQLKAGVDALVAEGLKIERTASGYEAWAIICP